MVFIEGIDYYYQVLKVLITIRCRAMCPLTPTVVTRRLQYELCPTHYALCSTQDLYF